MVSFKKILTAAACVVLLCFASAFGTTITYDLNGGSLPDGTTYYSTESSGSSVVLDTPTKTGKIFAGWSVCTTESAGYNSSTGTCTSPTRIITESGSSRVSWVVPGTVEYNTTYTAVWEDDKFQVATTSLSNGDTFQFELKATGEFYIDWGDGIVEYISRTTVNDSPSTYSHTYANTSSKAYTIHFGGSATGYNGDGTNYDIAFACGNNSTSNVAAVSGSLGTLMPTLNSGVSATDFPAFIGTFSGCPFVSIPNGFFAGVTGASQSMFKNTFAGTSITSIPSDLFSGVTGSAASVFQGTFSGCAALTTIPENLFGGITGTAANMFDSTFKNCTSLTQLPNNLFQNIVVSSSLSTDMFKDMFSGCTNLGKSAINGTAGTYSVPATLFANLGDGSYSAPGAMSGIFNGTALATSCPNGYNPVQTNFRADWCEDVGNCATYDVNATTEYAVACIPSGGQICYAGQYYDTSDDTVKTCESNANYYCTDITMVCDANNTGKTSCPLGAATAASGATGLSDCVCPDGISYKPNGNIVTNTNISGATKSSEIIMVGTSQNPYPACAELYISVLDTAKVGINNLATDAVSINNLTDADIDKAGIRWVLCKYRETIDPITGETVGKYDLCTDAHSVCTVAGVITGQTATTGLMAATLKPSAESVVDVLDSSFVNTVSGGYGLDSIQSSSSCSACSAGTSWTGNACTPTGTTGCLAGEYLNASGATPSCTACPSGATCPSEFTVYTNANGTQGARYCTGANEYMSDSVNHTCSTCVAYSTPNNSGNSLIDSTGCVCNSVGFEWDSTYNNCDCDGVNYKKYYVDSNDTVGYCSPIYPCATGEYLDITDPTDPVCTTCPAGSACAAPADGKFTIEDSGTITACADGYYSEGGLTSCRSCVNDAGVSYLYTTVASGRDDITDCLAECPSITAANCGANASGCEYDSNAETLEINSVTKVVKHYGSACPTEITGCDGGYTSKTLSSWKTNSTYTLTYPGICSISGNVNVLGCTTLSNGMWQLNFAGVPVSDVPPVSEIKGIASCNTTLGDDSSSLNRINSNAATIAEFSQKTAGTNCWIKPTRLDGMEIDASGWVYVTTYANETECANTCGKIYDNGLLSFTSDTVDAVIATTQVSDICAANNIAITWMDGNNTAITGSSVANAGSCTFGGILNTPTEAVSKPGYTFLGWKAQVTTP